MTEPVDPSESKLKTRALPGVETREPSITPPPSASDQTPLKRPKPVSGGPRKRLMPEGIWTKCPKCQETIYRKELEAKLNVCWQCGYHFPLTAWERVSSLIDGDSFVQADSEMSSVDVLSFPGYLSKLESNQQKNWDEGCGDHGSRAPARSQSCPRGDGFWIQWRFHGICGGGKVDPHH